MTKIINCYGAFLGVIVTVLTALFGAYWYIFAAYLLCNFFDWLTGWYKSRKKSQESSVTGLKGILKKLGYWIIITVAFMMSYVFVRMGKEILSIDMQFLMLLGWFTLACLLINEIRSILENLMECGCHVPAVLIKGLAVTEKLMQQEKAEKEGSEGEEKGNEHFN